MDVRKPNERLCVPVSIHLYINVNVNLFDRAPLVKEEEIMITNDNGSTCLSVVEKDKIYEEDIHY